VLLRRSSAASFAPQKNIAAAAVFFSEKSKAK
jgi:hypothetical protein